MSIEMTHFSLCACRECRRKKLEDEIHESRQAQLQRKAEIRERERREQEEYKRLWEERNRLAEEEEKREKQQMYERKKQVQNDQLEQATEKRSKCKAEKEQEDKEAECSKHLLEEEDQIFSQYANRIVQEYSSCGKKIEPMLLQLNKKEKFSE